MIFFPPINPHHPSDGELPCLCHLLHLYETMGWKRCPFKHFSPSGSIPMLSHVKTEVLFLGNLLPCANLMDNPSNTVGTKACQSFARNEIKEHA